MSFSIRLTDQEKQLADSYAKLHSISLGEAFKRALFEKIEDEYDISVYHILRLPCAVSQAEWKEGTARVGSLQCFPPGVWYLYPGFIAGRLRSTRLAFVRAGSFFHGVGNCVYCA